MQFWIDIVFGELHQISKVISYSFLLFWLVKHEHFKILKQNTFVWKQDLTEFNTAHNKRITSLGIEEGSTNLAGVASLKRKRSSLSVAFREGEEIINPGKVVIADFVGFW